MKDIPINLMEAERIKPFQEKPAEKKSQPGI
jgi:hypothetical protein